MDIIKTYTLRFIDVYGNDCGGEVGYIEDYNKERNCWWDASLKNEEKKSKENWNKSNAFF